MGNDESGEVRRGTRHSPPLPAAAPSTSNSTPNSIQNAFPDYILHRHPASYISDCFHDTKSQSMLNQFLHW